MKKESDPELDPDPDSLVRGTDPTAAKSHGSPILERERRTVSIISVLAQLAGRGRGLFNIYDK